LQAHKTVKTEGLADYFPLPIKYLNLHSIKIGSSVCVMQWTGVIINVTLI